MITAWETAVNEPHNLRDLYPEGTRGRIINMLSVSVVKGRISNHGYMSTPDLFRGKLHQNFISPCEQGFSTLTEQAFLTLHLACFFIIASEHFYSRSNSSRADCPAYIATCLHGLNRIF